MAKKLPKLSFKICGKSYETTFANWKSTVKRLSRTALIPLEVTSASGKKLDLQVPVDLDNWLPYIESFVNTESAADYRPPCGSDAFLALVSLYGLTDTTWFNYGHYGLGENSEIRGKLSMSKFIENANVTIGGNFGYTRTITRLTQKGKDYLEPFRNSGSLTVAGWMSALYLLSGCETPGVRTYLKFVGVASETLEDRKLLEGLYFPMDSLFLTADGLKNLRLQIQDVLPRMILELSGSQQTAKTKMALIVCQRLFELLFPSDRIAKLVIDLKQTLTFEKIKLILPSLETVFVEK